MAPWKDRVECKRDYSFCSQLSDMLAERDALQRRVSRLSSLAALSQPEGDG